MAVFYSIESFHDFFIAPSKLNHFLSLRSVIDIGTILPGFLVLPLGLKNQILICLTFFRSLRIPRIFDILFEIIYYKQTVNYDFEEQHDKVIQTSEEVFITFFTKQKHFK